MRNTGPSSFTICGPSAVRLLTTESGSSDLRDVAAPPVAPLDVGRMGPPPLSDLHIAAAARAISCEGKVLPDTQTDIKQFYQRFPALSSLPSIYPNVQYCLERLLSCCLNFFRSARALLLPHIVFPSLPAIFRLYAFGLPRRSSHLDQHHNIMASQGRLVGKNAIITGAAG